MERFDVIVVGAGLAGLACGFDLSSVGQRVLVVEANPWVGGRTASWEQDGMPVESGLHRYLGFYKAMPALLERAGLPIEKVVQWEYDIEIRSADGTRGVFGVAPRYAPARTLAGLLGNNALLSPKDKISLVPTLALGLADYLFRPGWLDQQSARHYARARRATERAVSNLVVPLTAGLFFLPPERYSAHAFTMPFAAALRDLTRLRVGAFRGGMTDVMAAPLAAAIERRGGVVRTSAPVRRLLVESGRVTGVELESNEIIRARHVVVATSLRPAKTLLEPFASHPWYAPIEALPTMPVVTIQLELDHPSLPVDRTTFGPGTSMASFAEQSRSTFKHVPGRLSVILTPPERFIRMRPDEILRIVVDDAAKLGMQLEGHIIRYRVVRLPHDFYSLAPGNHHLRPDQATPIPGLTLAGDYTRQPLLGTMEGAVISGERAARLVLRESESEGETISRVEADPAPASATHARAYQQTQACKQTQASKKPKASKETKG